MGCAGFIQTAEKNEVWVPRAANDLVIAGTTLQIFVLNTYGRNFKKHQRMARWSARPY